MGDTMRLKPNDYVSIQSYKHDGTLHRTWLKALVLDEDEEKIIIVTNRSLVIESDGRKWVTREPAICYFYYNEWYNVISMIRNTGVHYYVNIASPALYDGEALKYIDYDLDVKASPKGKVMVLDREEYHEHAKKMGYSYALDKVVRHSLDKVLDLVEQKKSPFDVEEVEEYYQKYLKVIQNKNNNP